MLYLYNYYILLVFVITNYVNVSILGKKLRNDHQIFSHKGANQLEWDNSMM